MPELMRTRTARFGGRESRTAVVIKESRKNNPNRVGSETVDADFQNKFPRARLDISQNLPDSGPAPPA